MITRLTPPRRRAVAILLIAALLVSNSVAAAASILTEATRSTAPALRAAQRGNPWVNLLDGRELPTAYSSASSVEVPAFQRALSSQSLAPRALVAADFDRDGLPDVVSGYRGRSGGSLTLHRGAQPSRLDLAQNQSDLSAAFGAKAFEALAFSAQVFDAPASPDLLGAGDFDADGFKDLVAATRGSDTLYLLRGDGAGGLYPAQTVSLPGGVTALTTGDLNRRDGSEDLVVAVTTPQGAQALVFESPEGALNGEPQVFDLPAPATALAIGLLDDHYAYDLAVAAGSDLLIISGRDRTLSRDASRQATASPAIQRHSLGFTIVSMALGDFVGNEEDAVEIALLAPDGEIRVLDRFGAACCVLSAPGSTQIVRAKVSSLPNDDVIALDPVNRQVHILNAGKSQPAGVSGRLASLDAGGAPAAVLPMRLNGDALSDLVILAEGAGAPIIAPTAPMKTFVVNDEFDGQYSFDEDHDDGVCHSHGYATCTLRAAIEQANAAACPGADLIQFNIGAPGEVARISPKTFMLITETLTIDGTTDPAGQVELRGDMSLEGYPGLHFKAGNSLVRGMVINSFRGSGILIETGAGNVIEHNVIGPSVSGFSGHGNRYGVEVRTSNNTIQLNTISGNNETGVILTGSSGNKVLGNLIGAFAMTGWDKPLFNYGDGVLVQGSTNTEIGSETMRNTIVNSARSGIRITPSSNGTLIVNNHIGIDRAGAAVQGNEQYGVFVDGGASNTIGGNVAARRNVISGNTIGIVITGTTAQDNHVYGNYIGLGASGATAAPNVLDGVRITGRARSNDVGAGADRRNVISGNGGNGIALSESDSNDISSNYIGTNAGGLGGLGNAGNGVYVYGGDYNDVQFNLISGNGGDGIRIQPSPAFGADDTQIHGNIIGLDALGAAALGNTLAGISVEGAVDTTIGYTTTGDLNLISANGGYGLYFLNADSTTVQNNIIGADKTGMLDRGNAGGGIYLDSFSDYNLVGGATAGAGNLISGNDSDGVVVYGNHNILQGNLIGTNISGAAKLGNSRAGIKLLYGADTTIGGNTSAARNLISGNGQEGVRIEDSLENTIAGNYIGTNLAGTASLGNTYSGVRIHHGTDNTIGGATAGERNIVSGNGGQGVEVTGASATRNTIRNNAIGQSATGGALGNSAHGVYVSDAHHNTIGVTNTIAYNGKAGVFILSGVANQILSNTIHSNQSLGIALASLDVTANDSGDGDTGPNLRQNYPVISSVTVSASTNIQGSLDSAANTAFTLQFFTNTTCDSSIHGEGESLITTTRVTTNKYGKAGFGFNLPTKLPAGKYIAATATDPDGNTSEFSRCALGVASSGPSIEVNRTADAADANTADGVCDADAGQAGQQCTLRAAIQTANAIAGANTIIVPAGTYDLTLAGSAENNAATGDLDVKDETLLLGAGANTTVISMTSTLYDRVFHIMGGSAVSVTISGVTIRNGWELVDGGGGIYNQQGNLTLNAVTVRDNIGPSGGGIRNTGKLTITHSAIISNTALGGSGGGLYQNSSGVLLSLANTTLSRNQAQDNGGGIASFTGTVKLNNVTVVYNTADTDNSGDDGGGLYYGGGIAFTAKNSIVAENVDISPGTFPNGCADCAGAYSSAGYNLIGDKAYNSGTLQTGCLGFNNNDTVGGFRIGGNYVTYAAGTNPALDENGGTTPGHALFSPYYGASVDAANPAAPGGGGNACEPFDQRGQLRPVDGNTDGTARCDRGAFEYVPITVDIGNTTAVEGGSAVFAVTLLQPAAITVTVKYETVAQTASAGADYVTASGVVTFPIGSSMQTIAITTSSDALEEDDETFLVNLDDPSFIFLGKSQGIGTIVDDDSKPVLRIGDAAVTEGNTLSVTQAVFVASLSVPSGVEVTADYSTTLNTATPDVDYAQRSGRVTFPPGTTTRNISIPVLGDDLDESNETFTVNLGNATGATVGDGRGAGTITDDDTSAISIYDASAAEGDSGSSGMYFDVRLSVPSVQNVTVQYATSNGTAAAGSDYASTSGVLSIPAGKITGVISVTINGDTAREFDETFTMTLSSPVNGTIADGVGIGTITDDQVYRVFLPVVTK